MTAKELATQENISLSAAIKRLQRLKKMDTGQTVDMAGGQMDNQECPLNGIVDNSSGQMVDIVSGGQVVDKAIPDVIKTLQQEIETQKLLVTHWQGRFELKESQIEALQRQLAAVKNENLELRAQMVNDSVSEPEQSFPDVPDQDCYTKREFIDKCCQVLRKYADEPVRPEGIAEKMRLLKMRPNGMGQYTQAQLERFSFLAEQAAW